jgi:succinoglycan biosynthesis protein ExoM
VPLPPSDGRLTYVSVVFETEFPLLVLQARSMALFLDEALVHEILVIDNSASGIPAAVLAELRREYAHLAGRVQFVRPDEVCRVPAAGGWRSQQVLKLCISDRVATRHYVVLDAKNHFVATPDAGFFESADGRPTANAYSFETHPLRPELERTLTYLGLEPDDHVGRFTATVTPFVLDTTVVRELIAGLEAREGRPFPDVFVEQQLTEFFLYAGWIVARGTPLDEFFELHQQFCPIVWPGKADTAGVEKAVDEARERRTPLFAVHRRALIKLDAPATTALAGYWASVGLFSDQRAAEQFVQTFVTRYAQVNRRRKLREARLRTGSALRRRARRLLPRKSPGSLRSTADPRTVAPRDTEGTTVPTSSDQLGKILLAVLTYQRNEDLVELLPQLVAQLDGRPGEVLVVDNDPDGSAATTVAALELAEVRYVHERQPGIAHARNRALDEAGDAHLLVFIDDDERPDAAWLTQLLDCYQREQCVAVAGAVIPDVGRIDDPWIEAGGFFVRSRHETGSELDAASTANLLIDLRQLEALGSVRFDERFGLTGGSDTLFTRELVARGGRIVWCDEAVVTDYIRTARANRAWVLQRHFRAGNSWARTSVELSKGVFATLLMRLRLTFVGVARIVLGSARSTYGTVVRSPRHQARGRRTAARGVGMTLGAWGRVYVEYRRKH